jgi:hypothetical protein
MFLTQVLAEFLAYKFPFWGVCHIKFDPGTRTVYLHSYTANSRVAILRNATEIAHLDIGVDRFVVVLSGYGNMTIDLLSRQK